MRNFSPMKKFYHEGKFVKETEIECLLRNLIGRGHMYWLQYWALLGCIDDEQKRLLQRFYEVTKEAQPSNVKLLTSTAIIKHEETGIVRAGIDTFRDNVVKFEGYVLGGVMAAMTYMFGLSGAAFFAGVYLFSFLVTFCLEDWRYGDLSELKEDD
jgi:hypothetical protein